MRKVALPFLLFFLILSISVIVVLATTFSSELNPIMTFQVLTGSNEVNPSIMTFQVLTGSNELEPIMTFQVLTGSNELEPIMGWDVETNTTPNGTETGWFSDVTPNATTITPGQSIRIEVNVTDSGAPASEHDVYLSIKYNSTGEWIVRNTSMAFNSTSNLFYKIISYSWQEGQYDVSLFAVRKTDGYICSADYPGLFSVQPPTTSSTTTTTSSSTTPSSTTSSATTTSSGNLPPKISSFSVKPRYATIGQQINVTVIVEDADTALSEITVTVYLNNTRCSASYDANQNLFVAYCIPRVVGVYDLSITLDDGVNVISSLFPRMVTIYPLQEVYPLGENTTTTTTTQPSSEPDIISVSREHAFEIFMMILMLLIFLQLLKRKEEEFSSFVRHSFSRMFQHSKIREEG